MKKSFFLTITIIILSSGSNFVHSQRETNKVGPSPMYPGYLETYELENLFGTIKSVKKYSFSNKNYHLKETNVLLADTFMKDLMFELNKNKEIITVASMKSSKLPNWKLVFRDKIPIESWGIQKNDSLKLTRTFHYNNSGMLEMIVSNIYSYEEKYIFYYKNNIPVKSECISNGGKIVHEWLQNNDSICFLIQYKVLKDTTKIYEHTTKFITNNNKIVEIRYNSRNSQPKDKYFLTNEYYRWVSILNNQNQTIEETITTQYENTETISFKYKYDISGRRIYHEQYNHENDEKHVAEIVYNENGQKIKNSGVHYKNNEMQYTTLNISTYDEFGNLKSENQSGSIHVFQYLYDSNNNWTTKKHYIGDKLFQIESRIIEYFE